MCMEMTPWEKCVEFHGHTCPGLAVGYKAALIALEELGIARASDEEMVAIVENDACGIDAIQVLTGCTFGKGNLIFRDYGKQVYTFGNRKTGDAVRLVITSNLFERNPEHRELMKKVMQGKASGEEKELFWENHRAMSEEVKNIPAQEFCQVKRVDIDLPAKAKIFNSVICAVCGESVMETRARIKDGKTVCLPCC